MQANFNMPRPNRKPLDDTKPRPYLEIGQRIREFRISKGLNQEDLTGAGVTMMTIRRVEGGTHLPNADLLIYLRNEHGADLNELLCGE